MATAKPVVVIRGSNGMAVISEEDKFALRDLLYKIVHADYKVEVDLPDPANLRPHAAPITSVGIFMPAGISDAECRTIVAQASKGAKKWLRDRLIANPDIGPISATIWGHDATQHKCLHATNAQEIKEISRPKSEPPRPTPQKAATLMSTFLDFKLSTRFVLGFAFGFGWLLLAALWLTDVGVNLTVAGFDPKPTWMTQYNEQWLHSHAYVPNILAGFTSFLIGAPVATVILATFTIQREERAALDRINSISALAWNKFRNSVNEFTKTERADQGLGYYMTLVEAWHNKIFGLYQHYISLAQTYNPGTYVARGPSHEEIKDFQTQLSDCVESFEQVISSVDEHVETDYQLTIRWSAIKMNWNTLNEYVRLQRLEQSLPWFEDRLDAELMIRLQAVEHPIQTFVALHSLAREQSNNSMYAALEAAQQHAKLPAEEVTKLLLAGYTSGSSQLMYPEYYYGFGYKPVEGYKDAATDATNSLYELRHLVESVERTGWPNSARQPVVLEV